jgi:hemerythrin-like domain-containing protein
MNRSAAFLRFHRDHAHVLERVDELERSIGSCLASAIPPVQESAIRELVELLQRQFATHMRAEEEVLFPVLARALPGSSSTLEPLEAEHAELRQMLSDLCNWLAASRSPARDTRLRVELRDLLDLIRLHVAKEEAAVFVVAERVLTRYELEFIESRLALEPGEHDSQSRRSTP